jgi:hypothetical protein
LIRMEAHGRGGSDRQNRIRFRQLKIVLAKH